MFGKKIHTDVKKSTQKFLDTKKDASTRLKHLRVVIGNADVEELSEFLNAYYKQIYYLVCECIENAETNLKQRASRLPEVIRFVSNLSIRSPSVHKTHREELESALFVLEKLLLSLPELFAKGSQQHALLHTFRKILHTGNSPRLRRDAVRYFIIWYQTLGENAPKEVDAVFATLVPGFPSPFPGMGLPPSPLPTAKYASTSAVFHDSSGPNSDVLPVLPPQSGEKPVDDPICFYLDVLLNAMVSQVGRIEWKEKFCRAHKSFSFLLERFKIYYLPHIFPSWSNNTSLYPPVLDLPVHRKLSPEEASGKDPMLSCRVCLIKWVATYTHSPKRDIPGGPPSHSNSITPDAEQPRISVAQTPILSHDLHEDMITATVKEVLYSTRENVCFVLEIYRQAFLLPFTHAPAIRKAISVYKDWIQLNVPDIPPFILEPVDGSDTDSETRIRLRNDSYIGAVHRDHILVRAGLQNTLQLFVTHAANVFLVNSWNSSLLEEQVDTCKRVLNIYRFMVMQTRMELSTWEQLLTVLLQITSLVLSRTPPKRKDETLGGKLAQAIFQTLIVTWIKANLNVVISPALWDQFLSVLTSLTQWEELIREWAKTLETLTRVLARHVYDLDLNDLPLDRLSKGQKQRLKGCQADGPRTSQRRNGRIPKTPQNSLQETCNTPDTSGSFQLCPPRKRVDSAADYTSIGHIPHRSHSDSNLPAMRRRRSVRQIQQVSVEQCPVPSVQMEVDGTRMSRPRRWKSLDSLRHEESPPPTRSPSPAPSSGIESSIKDSPMGLDFVSADAASLGECGESPDGRSVMAGGCVRGWLPDVAVVLWRRMLGALGDINRLPDPNLHGQVFEHLLDLWNTLSKIQANQGIPDEGENVVPPSLVPPLALLAPWCFKALELPDSYQQGKLCAYRLLCRMVLAVPIPMLSTQCLSQIYRALHGGLASPSPQVLGTVLKALGPTFLSKQLPGYSLLLLDLISAAKSVLESSDLQSTPRIEAASILGSVLSLPYMVSQAPCLDPRSPAISTLNCAGSKELVVASLLRAARREGAGIARCIALSALGVFLYTELPTSSPHPAVTDALNLILKALTFRQRSVSLVACDLLSALCDHVPTLLAKFPNLPIRVVRVLANVLSIVGPNSGLLGPALALVMGEWVMRIPLSVLLEPAKPKPLILTVVTVLNNVYCGRTSNEPVPADFDESLPPDWDNSIKVNDLRSPRKQNQHLERTNSALACRAVLMHLVSHLGHFPMGLGASRLTALVQEHDDVPALGSELSVKLFTAPNVQLMMVRNSLMSLVEVEQLTAPGGGVTAGLVTANHQSRVLLRDLANKASWDASQVYCSPQDVPDARRVPPLPSRIFRVKAEDSQMSLMVSSVPTRGTLRHRPLHILPNFQNAAPDMDNVHDLLRYIGHTSPECLQNPEEELSEPCPPSAPLSRQTEAEVISAVLSQRTAESDYYHHCREVVESCVPPNHTPPRAPFQHCRSLVSQLGLTGWDRRSQVHMLKRTEHLLREIRNMDRQRNRETHKIAVIYVGAGQEDKNSILSNRGGSQAFEQFVAGLAWEVELATHTGFTGGLGSGCGETAPYYASAFVETLFHVSTRMPSDTGEDLLQKMRHLGNDEVHIVWSEHYRDYRRSSFPTEFCDVLIVIYPLPDSLYRVTVDTKSEMPVFGPLWNEAIVEGRALAGLVRASAIAASRAQRRTLQHYRTFYEDRSNSLSDVVTNLKDPKSFEEFAAAIFCPYMSPGKSEARASSNDSRIWDRVSPQQPKKLSFRPEPESPILSRTK